MTVSLSVVIPTYNKASYLAMTLASFQSQTLDDFEVVVIDDGSTDCTRELLAGWPDPRVRVLCQPNAGRSAARNRGVAAALGQWVVFCDDDRIAAPHFLEAHMRRLQARPDSLVIGFKHRVLTHWQSNLPLEDDEFKRIAHRLPERAPESGMPHLLCTPDDIRHDLAGVIEQWSLDDELDNYKDLVIACRGDLSRSPMAWALATTANMSVARDHLDGVDTFDEDYRGWGVEDNDLSFRLHRKGLAMCLERRAANHHQVHPLGRRTLEEDAQQRGEECHYNLLRFCAKFDQLDSYLFWRSKFGMGLLKAQEWLLQARQDPLLHEELLNACRQSLRAHAHPESPIFAHPAP